jgi:hypothetical protein
MDHSMSLLVLFEVEKSIRQHVIRDVMMLFSLSQLKGRRGSHAKRFRFGARTTVAQHYAFNTLLWMKTQVRY